ncbi:putative outer membrane protein [Pedobacter sp. BAL39]|uniref:SusC/RagA family TonB-linked outer membrane protein n=1 Tax=Pedobacter sp. BAL39 TaxID=391596 RepID=UPI0001559A6F|nr:TonB-dependent receptor [Pedobacter sp. BAL39]EDM38634.1 putative outer membrane protein [Pedobacter sp. BAL39]
MYNKLFKRPVYAINFALSKRHTNHEVFAANALPIFTKLMKFSLIQILGIVVAVQLSWSAPVNAQLMEKRVSIEFTNQKLEEALTDLASSAKFRLVYNNQIKEDNTKFSGKYNGIKVKELLVYLLKNSNLTYEVINDQFVVIRSKGQKEESPVITAPVEEPKISSSQQGFVISGIVLDENDEPMPGVSLKAKTGGQATTTNAKGRFALGISAPGTVVEFSFIGYRLYQTTVNAEIDLQVKMKPDPAKLDEVVVIGYGTTTRRTSTGSQVGITAKDIEKQPVTNALQTLQGRMPGVQVTQTNGLPGAGINVQIRGANSIGKSNRPLYIIDGVPFLSEPINTASSSTSVLPSAEGNTSPLNTINPSDIESLEVLKDADATAIYGSRGANGVVLITTKKGAAGKTKFNVNASSGASVVGHFIDLMNTEQYLALRRKGFANGTTNPTAPSATNAPDLVSWDQNTSTDWQRELLGGTARTNDVTANVSGGDANTNFYMSGTYHQEGNVYPGDQGYKRGGVNVSLNHSSIDRKFNVGFSAIYSTDKNNISSTELANYAYSLAPNFPIYKADGSLNWVGGNNPYGFLYQTNDNRSSNLLGSLNLKYTILEGLDIKSTFGYSKTDMNQVVLRPLMSLSTAYTVPVSGTASYAYTYANNYIVEPQITYNRKIWKGSLSALLGGTYQSKQSRQPYYTSAQGFSSDDFLRNVSSATTVSTSSSSRDYKYASVFGRINYNVADKYILNLNFRRDGSSRFGPDKKFGNFGSVGAAWVFSEENFLKDKFSWFSFGKLRGSYGVVGSDEIGDYQYLESFTASTASYNGVSSLNPSRIANAAFQWETTKKLEVGLELGFFDDRLSLTGNYYRNRSGNQLISYPLSAQTGFTSYQSNLPATVQNSGVELAISSTNIRTKEFTWTSGFNISKNANKLLSFPNIEKTSYYTTYLVGRPISSFYAYQFTGIDPATNLPAFTDFNGVGGTASPTTGLSEIGRGDRYFVGSAYPSFFGGLTNTLTYKGLTLDFTFQFVKQRGRSLAAASFYPPGYMYNMATSVVDEYLALGSQDYLVTAGTAGTNGRPAYFGYSSWTGSDANIVDASFIRMKNVNLSYVLPTKWVSKLHAQQIRVFTQAQNLFTITNYKGYDPESQGIVTPPLRTVVAGLQFTF